VGGGVKIVENRRFEIPDRDLGNIKKPAASYCGRWCGEEAKD
jgi:hypothetical protein